MLKEKISTILQENNYLYKSLEKVETKELGSRKKIDSFLGEGARGSFVLFYSATKSRVLKGDIDSLELLAHKLSSLKGVVLREKFYISCAPFCSKATQYALTLGWRVVHVSL